MLDAQVLSALLEKYRDALGKPVRTFTLGGRLFDFNRYRYLVGVINLSTDSWYRESVCATTEEAIRNGVMWGIVGALREINYSGAIVLEVVPTGPDATASDARRRSMPIVDAYVRESIGALRAALRVRG